MGCVKGFVNSALKLIFPSYPLFQISNLKQPVLYKVEVIGLVASVSLELHLLTLIVFSVDLLWLPTLTVLAMFVLIGSQ